MYLRNPVNICSTPKSHQPSLSKYLWHGRMNEHMSGTLPGPWASVQRHVASHPCLPVGLVRGCHFPSLPVGFAEAHVFPFPRLPGLEGEWEHFGAFAFKPVYICQANSMTAVIKGTVR